MRDDVPAWPPGASRSTTSVRSPSEAPYTAAASPAGPAPTITVSYSASAGSVVSPSRSATCRSSGRMTVSPATHWIAGQSCSGGNGPSQYCDELGLVGRDPLERDLIAVEKVPELGARRVPALPDHHRARRRRRGGEPGQASRPPDPVPGQLADLDRHARSGGRDGVVVVGREPHHARGLGSAKPNGKHSSERDRHLAEHVARLPYADHGLDPVRGLDRLDSPFEQPEQRALAALVSRVLARDQADVGNGARKPLALRFAELSEDRDSSDLFGSDHGRKPTVGLDAPSCLDGRSASR